MKTFEMYSPHNRVKQKVQIGKWNVKKNGDMCYDGWYLIHANRLTKEDWITHLFEKRWIDFNEFIPAYFQALKNAGKEFVTIRIFY